MSAPKPLSQLPHFNTANGPRMLTEMASPSQALGEGSVEIWLRDLDTNIGVGANEECEESINKAAKTPQTPVRAAGTVQCEEASPTNTSFSYDSCLVDSPSLLPHTHNNGDNISEATSVCCDKDCNLPSDQGALRQLEQSRRQFTRINLAINHAQSAGSDTDTCTTASDDKPFVPKLDFNPNNPRLVWITSCLQCTLAKLPCSRTPPACIRCVRNGHGDECVMQRRRVLEELVKCKDEDVRVPVMLKVRGVDERVWARKMEVVEALKCRFQEKQDRENWVLPNPYGVKKAWHMYGVYATAAHPGEGVGRLTCKELTVELDLEGREVNDTTA